MSRSTRFVQGRLLLAGLLLTSAPVLGALEGELSVTADQQSVWVIQAPNPSPVQTDYQRLQAQGTLGDRWQLSDNLSAAGTVWALADTLPAQSPRSLPEKKTEFSSRILEARLHWEPVPGTWMVDAGKKLTSLSSGFSHKPLDFFRRNTSTASDGSAGSKWEEGWAGAEAGWTGEVFSVSNFFVPRLEWSDSADQTLRYLGLPQKLWEDQVKVTFRVGEADLRLLGLVSTPDGQGSWVFKTGAGLDTNVGDRLTFRAEGSAASSVDRQRVSDDALMLVKTETLAWAPQILTGVTWTGDHDFSIMAEYYFNGLGDSGAGYDRLIRYTKNLRQGAGGLDLMNANGLLENACHYLFLRISGRVDDKVTAETWTQTNLQDLSTLYGAGLHLTQDKWALSANLVNLWGKPDSELGVSPLLWKLSAELNLYL